MSAEGSTDEKKAKVFPASSGIDNDSVTMEQFAALIDILNLSKYMNSPISQRGTAMHTHGKEKQRKR